ncbi:cadherin-24 [Gadus chalcogrammus]|uniref:cadherin-24 n=1 Tax=Gadus chalcogrammus TaxID=1042646 RepID=UPI0024C4CE9A|nr:cadherin-24 [Gadus chalcogrammus]
MTAAIMLLMLFVSMNPEGGDPTPTTALISGSPESAINRRRRSWLWNQFFVIEEYRGPEPVLIGRLHSDMDAGDGRTRYTLEGEGVGSVFVVDGNTGNIHVTKSLDREEKEQYRLVATATDRRTGRALEPSSEFLIRVQDINDNAPAFARGSYVATVTEMADMGTSIIQVTALDADDPSYGYSARLVYTVTHGQDAFSVDAQTGVLRTAVADMDRETQEEYLVVLEAKDMGGHQGGLSGTTTVTVTLADVNDNPPHFRRSAWTFSVSELAAPGVEVGRLTASDPDLGVNAQLDFTLVDTDGAGDTFNLTARDREAVIVLNKLLDFESRSSYSFSVEVSNPVVDPRFLRKGPFKDLAGVRVLILDADEPPRFSRPRYRLDVSENCPPVCSVGRVSAVDPDSPPSPARYSIDPQSDPEAVFRIGSDTGFITTVIELDREQEQWHNITAIATQRDNPSLVTRVVVAIETLDQNDNAPELDRQYATAVCDSSAPGQVVQVLRAIDRDQGGADSPVLHVPHGLHPVLHPVPHGLHPVLHPVPHVSTLFLMFSTLFSILFSTMFSIMFSTLFSTLFLMFSTLFSTLFLMFSTLFSTLFLMFSTLFSIMFSTLFSTLFSTMFSIMFSTMFLMFSILFSTLFSTLFLMFSTLFSTLFLMFSTLFSTLFSLWSLVVGPGLAPLPGSGPPGAPLLLSLYVPVVLRDLGSGLASTGTVTVTVCPCLLGGMRTEERAGRGARRGEGPAVCMAPPSPSTSLIFSMKPDSLCPQAGDEDLRENIISYDDEGGGEADTAAFDMAALQSTQRAQHMHTAHNHTHNNAHHNPNIWSRAPRPAAAPPPRPRPGSAPMYGRRYAAHTLPSPRDPPLHLPQLAHLGAPPGWRQQADRSFISMLANANASMRANASMLANASGIATAAAGLGDVTTAAGGVGEQVQRNPAVIQNDHEERGGGSAPTSPTASGSTLDDTDSSLPSLPSLSGPPCHRGNEVTPPPDSYSIVGSLSRRGARGRGPGASTGEAAASLPMRMEDFLNFRLKRVTFDLTQPPYDSLQTYEFEGRGSRAGSLSSLESEEAGEEERGGGAGGGGMAALNQKFRRLETGTELQEEEEEELGKRWDF